MKNVGLRVLRMLSEVAGNAFISNEPKCKMESLDR